MIAGNRCPSEAMWHRRTIFENRQVYRPAYAFSVCAKYLQDPKSINLVQVEKDLRSALKSAAIGHFGITKGEIEAALLGLGFGVGSDKPLGSN